MRKYLLALLGVLGVGAFAFAANEVISINFASGKGSVENNATGGIVSVPGTAWTNVTDASKTVTSVNVWDGETAISVPVTLSYSASGVYQYTDNVTDNFLKGYLDDGTNDNDKGIEISLGVPFEKYDVYVYFATDTGGNKFVAPTVNNKRYTANTDTAATNVTKTKEGDDNFGTARQGKAALGTNALLITDQKGTLTITNGPVSTDPNSGYAEARGGIAAIQIVNKGSLKNIAFGQTFNYVFTGAEDAIYKNDANWDVYGAGALTALLPAPGIKVNNNGIYLPFLIDGNQMVHYASNDGYKTVALAEDDTLVFEGWTLRLGVKNGAQLTIDSLAKFQTDDGSPEGWIYVDETSQVIVKAFGAGNWSNRAANFHIAAPEGLVFKGNANQERENNTRQYYLDLQGSVKYETTAVSRTHTIAEMVLNVGPEAGSKALIKRKLIDVSTASNNQTIQPADSISVTTTTEVFATKTNDNAAPTADADLGTYGFASMSDGLYVVYVGKAVAEVNGYGYFTLAEAIEAAGEAGVVEVLSDVTVPAGKTLNIGTTRPTGTLTFEEGAKLKVDMGNAASVDLKTSGLAPANLTLVNVVEGDYLSVTPTQIIVGDTLVMGADVWAKTSEVSYIWAKKTTDDGFVAVTIDDLKAMAFAGTMAGAWVKDHGSATGYQIATDDNNVLWVQMQKADDSHTKCVILNVSVEEETSLVKIKAWAARYYNNSTEKLGTDLKTEVAETIIGTNVATGSGEGGYGIHSLTATPAVATVVATGANYATLDAAMSAAGSVTLTNAITDDVTIPAGKEITLTGNSFLTGKITVEAGATLKIGSVDLCANVTKIINNGTVINTADGAKIPAMSGSGNFEASCTSNLTGAMTISGTVTLDGGVGFYGNQIVNGPSIVTNNAGARIGKSGDTAAITIATGKTLKGPGWVVAPLTFAENAILDGTTTVIATGTVNYPSAMTVKGALNACVLKIASDPETTFAVADAASYVRAAYKTDGLYIVTMAATVGDKYYENIADAIAADGAVTILHNGVTLPTTDLSGETIKLAGGVTIEAPADYKWENGTLVKKVYVAQIEGGASYETLQEAIDVAAGQTVTLIDDLTIADTVTFGTEATYTLDLNGKTLTIDTDSNDGLVVTGGATLNLTNGSYKFDCASSSYDAVFVNNGTLNIGEGVKMDVAVTANSALHAYNNATINMTGGAITMKGTATTSVGAIQLTGNATLEMTGGTIDIAVDFDENYDSWNRDACGLVLLGANNHAYLKGGSFTVNGKNSFAQGVQIATMNGSAEKTDFVVDGTNFAVYNTGAGECYPFAIYDPEQGSVEVKSGSVTGNFTAFVTQAITGDVDLEVSGGTFSTEVPEEYLADGFVVNKNTDGTYGVEKFVAAMIGEPKFDTFQAALDAANDGDTITLCSNVEWETGAQHDSTPFADHSITIDGQSKYTLTATGKGIGEICVTSGTLTLTNLKIVDKSVSYAEGNWELGYLEFKGALVAENVTFNDPILFGGTTAKFTTCAFVGKTTECAQYGVWVTSGEVAFDECGFTGTRGVKAHSASGTDVEKLEVTGSTFEVTDKPGIALGAVKESTITVTGNTFNGVAAGDQNQFTFESDTDLGSFTLTREDNTINMTEETAPEAGTVTDGTYEYDPTAYIPTTGYKVIENADGTWTVEDLAVATVTIGTTVTKYETLNDAMKKAYATPGEVTVKVVKNAEFSLTYDVIYPQLMTKMMSMGGATHIILDLQADVTVKTSMSLLYSDSMTVIGTGKMTFVDAGAITVSTSEGVDGTSELTINGGTFVNETTGDGAIIVASGSALTVTDGTFEGESIIAASYNSATITLNGGTFSEDATLNIKNNPTVTKADTVTAPKADGYLWDGNTLVKPIAEVNGQEYAKLQAAIDAAPSGATVKLLADVTSADAFEVAKSMTIDLNGKTLTSTLATGYLFPITASNVAFTLTDTTDTKAGAISAKKPIVEVATAKGSTVTDVTVTVEYGTYTMDAGTPTSGMAAFLIAGKATTGTTCTFKNATINSAAMAIYAACSSATIESCTITAGTQNTNATQNAAVAFAGGVTATLTNSAVTSKETTATSELSTLYIMSSGANVTIEGGNYTTKATDVAKVGVLASSGGGKGVYTVNGGTFTGPLYLSGATATITGGTFTVDPTVYVADGYYTTKDGNSYTVIQNPVATVGGYYYDDLQKAINAATAGDTVTLMTDVEYTDDDAIAGGFNVNINKSLTLDLGAYTIANTMSTYTDSDGNPTFVNGGDPYSFAAVRILPAGDADIEVTINATTGGITTTSSRYAIRSGNNPGGATTTLTINGGNYVGGSTCISQSNGTVYITDGTFEATHKNFGQYYALNANVGSKGAFVVSGGKFIGFDPNQLSDGDADDDGKGDSLLKDGFTGYSAVESVIGKTLVADATDTEGDGWTLADEEKTAWYVIPTAQNSAYVSKSGTQADTVVTLWGEVVNVDPKSSLYMDIVGVDADGADEVLGTVTLNDIDGIYAAETGSLSWHAMVLGEEFDTYWTTDWAANPNDEPKKVKLYADAAVDGVMLFLGETAVQMSGADSINPVKWEELFVASITTEDGATTYYASVEAAMEAAGDDDIIVVLTGTSALNGITVNVTTKNGETVANGADVLRVLDAKNFTVVGDTLAYAYEFGIAKLTYNATDKTIHPVAQLTEAGAVVNRTLTGRTLVATATTGAGKEITIEQKNPTFGTDGLCTFDAGFLLSELGVGNGATIEISIKETPTGNN